MGGFQKIFVNKQKMFKKKKKKKKDFPLTFLKMEARKNSERGSGKLDNLGFFRVIIGFWGNTFRK